MVSFVLNCPVWYSSTTARGDYATAIGYKTTANGNYSLALGYKAQATGQHAVVWFGASYNRLTENSTG